MTLSKASCCSSEGASTPEKAAMEANSRRTLLKRAATNTAALLDAAVAASGHSGSLAAAAAAASRSRTPARISCIHQVLPIHCLVSNLPSVQGLMHTDYVSVADCRGHVTWCPSSHVSLDENDILKAQSLLWWTAKLLTLFGNNDNLVMRC